MRRNIKHRGQILISLLCSLVFVFSGLTVQAEDETSLTNRTATLQSELNGINQELVTISDQITETEREVLLTTSEIVRTQTSLAEAEANEAQQYEDMKSRIKYMYETGNATLLEMLFSAESMSDFLNKADFIQNISDYDRDMLLTLQETQQTIAERKEALNLQQSALTEVQNNLEKRKIELIQKANETSTDLNNFNVQLADLRAAQAAQAAQDAQNATNQNTNNGSTTTPGNNTSGGYDNSIVNGGGSTVSGNELDILAAIVECEAYHNYEYMLAVATVIMNRVNDPRFPNTISGVVYAPQQFSPAGSGTLDLVLSRGPSALAYTVAQDAINGARLAAVQNCYYFLAESAAVQPGVNIGGNVFFTNW